MKNEDAGITSERRGLLLALVAIGAAFGVLSWLTWYYSDDYPMAFTFCADHLAYDKPIRSIGDVIYSQYYHYLTQHGRIVTEGLVQYFIGLRDKHVFDAFNMFFFSSYVYLLLRYAGHINWRAACFVVATTLLLTRSFGEVFLWLSGSINYLWVACANLFLIKLYKDNQHNDSLFKAILLFLFSFMTGSMQEGFSIGISAAFAASMWHQLRQEKRGFKVPVFINIGYILGMLFDILSPGIWIRAYGEGLNSSYDISDLSRGVVHVLSGLRIFWVMVIVACIQATCHRISIRCFIHQHAFLLIAMSVQALFLMGLGGIVQPRGLFAIDMFSLIILLNLLPIGTIRIAFISLAVAGCIYLPVLQMTWKNHRITQEFLKELYISDGTVFFDLPHYSPTEAHYLGSKLIMNHRSSLFIHEAAFYGKKNGILVLPKRMREELYTTSSFINTKNYYKNGEYTSKDLSFTVTPLPNDKPLPKSTCEREYVSFPSGNYMLKDRTDVTFFGRKKKMKRKT